jgi:hypothetical protein
VDEGLLNVHNKDVENTRLAKERMDAHIAKRLKLEESRFQLESCRIEKEDDRYVAVSARDSKKATREAERHRLEMAKNEDDLFFSRYERFEAMVQEGKRTVDKAGPFVWRNE